MPKVKFLRDTLFESEGRNKGPVYSKGRVYVMSSDQVERWVRRGDAEAYETPEAEAEEPKAEAPKAEKPKAAKPKADEPKAEPAAAEGEAVQLPEVKKVEGPVDVPVNEPEQPAQEPRRVGRPSKVQPS